YCAGVHMSPKRTKTSVRFGVARSDYCLVMRVQTLPLALLVVLAAACNPDPVAWGEPKPITAGEGPSRLVVDSTGAARFVADTVRPGTLPAVAGLCAGTLRSSPGRSVLFASWWDVRRERSAALY